LRRLMEQIMADPRAFEQNINENMRRNGERVWIAWTNKTVLDDQGLMREILSIGHDITERRRADEALREARIGLEHRVRQRTAELAVAKERAESADRLKSAFLATMSHELRTPLNSIIGFAGIMMQELAGPLNPEQAKQLGMVQSSARHLLALINDVLDISKIEAGQMEIRAEPFHLLSSIEKVVALVRPLAEKKGLALRLEPPPPLEPVVADRLRVEQVLLNLLNNAIKFTEKGEVVLTAEVVPHFKPAHHASPQPAVRLRVVDTGIGIQRQDLAKLFLPFRQIDFGITRQHEGTGLGLAICHRLAQLMGGAMAVESVWGKGSTFSFTFPMHPGNHP
jgi:signal transduction histidine kinase